MDTVESLGEQISTLQEAIDAIDERKLRLLSEVFEIDTSRELLERSKSALIRYQASLTS